MATTWAMSCWQGVSAAINAFAMKDTLVARLGGEEFSVAGFFSGAVEARLYADALVRAVEVRTHRCGEEDVRVTISFGYCLSEPDETLSAMLTRADAALYAAKAPARTAPSPTATSLSRQPRWLEGWIASPTISAAPATGF